MKPRRNRYDMYKKYHDTRYPKTDSGFSHFEYLLPKFVEWESLFYGYNNIRKYFEKFFGLVDSINLKNTSQKEKLEQIHNQVVKQASPARFYTKLSDTLEGKKIDCSGYVFLFGAILEATDLELYKKLLVIERFGKSDHMYISICGNTYDYGGINVTEDAYKDADNSFYEERKYPFFEAMWLNAKEKSALIFLMGHKYKNAFACLNEALKKDPNNPLILHNLAYAFFKMEKYGDALELVNRRLEVTPNDTKLLILKKHTLTRLKKEN